jgi:hypothetical protein
MEGAGAGVYGQTVGRRLSTATVFQAEIYAILACVYKIPMNGRTDKYVNVCSDSHAALLALQTAKTTPPLV